MLWQVALTFSSMVALDFVWARYNLSCAEKRPFVSGVYAAIIAGLGAVVVVTYVEDHRLLMPAAAGAFVGTFGSVWLSKRER